jgi:regulator of PEP synthase PpsR (kinase-PPPase family)
LDYENSKNPFQDRRIRINGWKKYAFHHIDERTELLEVASSLNQVGLQILTEHLGDIEAERFIALIQREPFDYTKCRQGLDEDLSIEDISKKAMDMKKNTEQKL